MTRKRRICGTSIMTEFDTIKPYFINASDDLIASCAQDSASPNDDIWKKFELLPTPPRSPKHSRDNDDLKAPCNSPIDSDVENFDRFNELDLDVASTNFPSPKEDSTDVETYQDKIVCECDSKTQLKLIKDCMWNGVGHKSSVEKYKNVRNRRSSPTNSPCHASGCVDPRNIFPYPVGQSTCCDQKTRRFPSPPIVSPRPRPVVAADGAETPSDSEEEIDVVTVESKQQVINVLKSKNRSITSVPASQKIMGTLVPKENGGLTLVTTGALATNFATNGLKTNPEKKDGDSDRGRPRNKQIHVLSAANGQNKNLHAHTVAMVIERRVDQKSIKEGKQVKLQVKNIVGNDVTKRRHTVEECNQKITQAQLMKMANPKSVMESCGSVSPDSRGAGGKKRILSLDGISFCSTTGIRQYNTEYNRQKDIQRLPTLSFTPALGALKTAQETAINITAVRNKTKPRQMPVNGGRRKEVEEIERNPTRVLGSPQNKRKRKAEPLNIGSSGSGSDSEQIRAAHNVLERQRREGLRASFHALRDNVPDLRNVERTPKVNILNKARDYCLQIAESERKLIAEKEKQLRRNQRLALRLERVRESLNLSSLRESDMESEYEDQNTQENDNILSPESSLPPSLPSSPQIYAPQPQNGFIIARRDSNGAQPELVLRLETCNSTTRPTEQRKRFLLTSDFQGQQTKQVKYNSELHMMLASLQQKKADTNYRALSFQNSEGLSDGYEECYESEEDSLRCDRLHQNELRACY